MTRETKIGLLVGLAFILVVGILLSEHITGSNDRPAAPLADAGHGVRTGVSAPGAAADEPARLPEPQQPVPTPADLTPKPSVTHVTVVTPPDGSGQSTVVVTPPQPAPQPVASQPVAPQPVAPQPQPAPQATPVVIHAPTDPFANDPISRIARQMGEVVVPVDAPVRPPTPGKAVNKVAPNATAVREYKAQPGDTLSRLAALLPGGNVKANRDAVVGVNPSLQKDPNRVLSGHAYLLPAGGTAATPVADRTAPNADPKPETKAIDKPDARPLDVAQRTYVVKAGDTLSKIASSELGSKAEIETIRKLNAELLKGRDVIKVDMKLKLPAKAAMASIR